MYMLSLLFPKLPLHGCVFARQNMNATEFRTCIKELYETRYGPVSVSYAVFTGW